MLSLAESPLSMTQLHKYAPFEKPFHVKLWLNYSSGNSQREEGKLSSAIRKEVSIINKKGSRRYSNFSPYEPAKKPQREGGEEE